jgi:putative peptidoglycan lipid II flippase
VVAYFFGSSHSTDIFFFVYSSLIILGSFIMNMNASVVIPESMKIRIEKGNEGAIQFLNIFIFLYGLITVVTVAIIFMFPIRFFSLVSNFSVSDLAASKTLLLLSLPLFCLICLINLLVDILASYKFFTISMVVGIINGIVSITFVTLFHNSLGIKSAFYSFLISYILNFMLLLYLLKKNVDWRFYITWPRIEKRIWKNLGFAQLGNLTSTLSLYTPIYILSGFSTGVVTALTFAQQISSLPNALVTTQFSSVAGIRFNELYAAGEKKEINRVFLESANFLHFLMIPTSFFIFTFADAIVEIVVRFTSLNAQTAGSVVLFLKYLGLLLPLMVVNTLMARLFMASHKIRQSFVYQVSFNLVLIACLYFAVNKLGIVGYPLAMVFTYLLNLGFCFFLEKKFFNFINYAQVLREFFILVVVNAAIIFAIEYSIKFSGVNVAILTVILASALYFVILLLVNKAFRLNDLVTVHFGNVLKKILSYGTNKRRQ